MQSGQEQCKPDGGLSLGQVNTKVDVVKPATSPHPFAKKADGAGLDGT